MSTTFTYLDSPLGRLRLVAAHGALVGIYLPEQPGAAEHGELPAPGGPVLEEAARQLTDYFAGRRASFDVPCRPSGTPFQRAVWTALGAIPFGSTSTYGELARAIGRPDSSRAVGGANARNPLSIMVPCHRVIGSDGSLHGYAGGTAAKLWLLDHEARLRGGRTRRPDRSWTPSFPEDIALAR